MSTPQNTRKRASYERPTLRPLGTLSELTLGGSSHGPSDGYGFAGDQGSVFASVTAPRPPRA